MGKKCTSTFSRFSKISNHRFISAWKGRFYNSHNYVNIQRMCVDKYHVYLYCGVVFRVTMECKIMKKCEPREKGIRSIKAYSVLRLNNNYNLIQYILYLSHVVCGVHAFTKNESSYNDGFSFAWLKQPDMFWPKDRRFLRKPSLKDNMLRLGFPSSVLVDLPKIHIKS